MHSAFLLLPNTLFTAHRLEAAPAAGSDRASATVTTSVAALDRKSTRLNSSHSQISYAVFCLKKKKNKSQTTSLLITLHLAIDPAPCVRIPFYLTCRELPTPCTLRAHTRHSCSRLDPLWCSSP